MFLQSSLTDDDYAAVDELLAGLDTSEFDGDLDEDEANVTDEVQDEGEQVDDCGKCNF